METWLRRLALVVGAACMAIGVLHFALGIHSVPGEGSAGPTVDSRERFYAAIFFAYGAAWWWAGRQSPVPWSLTRFLAAAFLAGGIGRVLSMLVEGQPQWFQIVLAVIELIVPLAFLWPGRAARSTLGSPPTLGSTSTPDV